MTTFLSPSYKRAGKVEVRRWLPEVTLAVHEFEAAEYENLEGGSIAVIPDELRGNMAKVRNWMLDYGWAQGDQIVMLDDDVLWTGFHDQRAQRKFTVEEFRHFVDVGFQMAEDVGAFLWGVNLQSDPKFYREYSPLSFLMPVLGPFSCHRKHPLRYDERLGLNEDYDMALQHLQKYHKILRFNKHYYMAGHLVESGGCAAYRTLDEETRQSRIMTAKWGSSVVSYDLKRSTNPRVRVPYKGI